MQQLITTPNKIKCINLDWLSVYCLEPKGVAMNAAYFKALGWTVEEREYGTPQYREKFTLMNGRHPFLEIERNPYSLNRICIHLSLMISSRMGLQKCCEVHSHLFVSVSHYV